MTREQKVVFAGSARNCGPHLHKVLQNIEQMAQLYQEAAFIFVENDSDDGTKRLLKEWCARRKNATLLTLDGLSNLQPVRTIRLQTTRRKYIQFARARYADHAHLFVLDCDDANAHEIDLQTVRRAIDFLDSDPSHAGVFANQDGTYYDMWALRHQERCPVDVWEELLDCTMMQNLPDQAAFNRTFAKRIFSLRADAAPVEVESAFGGLAIYKMSSVLRSDGNYLGYKKKLITSPHGWSEVGWSVCEHVAFNSGLRKKGGRLFILPYLINGVTKDVGFPSSAFRSLIFDRRLAMLQDSISNGLKPNLPCPCGSGKKYKLCHGRFD
jgi:hypothetical protein